MDSSLELDTRKALRDLLTGLHNEQPGEEPWYVGTSGGIYVFAFKPEGYETPVRVAFQIPQRSIDEEAEPSQRDAAEPAFALESRAFERLLPHLLQTRAGMFVAIRNGQVIDEDADEFDLASRVEQNHRSEFVLIRRVIRDLVVEHLESPEVEVG